MALLVSLVGTYVALREANILERQQELIEEQKAASVWPMLKTSYLLSYDREGAVLQIGLENKGVGPAIIGATAFTLFGDTVELSAIAARLGERPGGEGARAELSSDPDEGVLSAGEQTTVLRVRFPGSEVQAVPLGEFADALQLHYCYCSVYGTCWRVDGAADASGWPQPTGDCAAARVAVARGD